MRITIAKSAGFCFGVKRALSIAREAADKSKNVVMLGDIVHNEQVVKKIKNVGVKKINKLVKTKNKTLLIRAHGAALLTYKRAKKSGYTVVDATCPMVKEIHKIAKNFELNGYTIIVIGDKKHDEVLGIVGQLKNKALIIDSIKNIPVAKLKKIKKAAVVAQSTQNTANVLNIVKTLKKHVEKLVFKNTICNPTKTKQKEIQKIPLKNDVVIIIGSKTSANTRRLYEIASSLNPKTYWIFSEKKIKASWFKNVKSVGIAAGASTPDETTQEVIKRVKELTGK
jgi:4-hydroxy-3-methylbut-2-en-1-yl diphosphate reductase